jgi:hypothetical protein
LSEETIDNLVENDSACRDSFLSIRLVGELNDGPIVSAEEQRSEELFVEFEDELNESAESVLLDRSNVVLVEGRRVNPTKIEDREEELEDDAVVLDNVGSLAMSKSACEQVEETENGLNNAEKQGQVSVV